MLASQFAFNVLCILFYRSAVTMSSSSPLGVHFKDGELTRKWPHVVHTTTLGRKSIPQARGGEIVVVCNCSLVQCDMPFDFAR